MISSPGRVAAAVSPTELTTAAAPSDSPPPVPESYERFKAGPGSDKAAALQQHQHRLHAARQTRRGAAASVNQCKREVDRLKGEAREAADAQPGGELSREDADAFEQAVRVACSCTPAVLLLLWCFHCIV